MIQTLQGLSIYNVTTVLAYITASSEGRRGQKLGIQGPRDAGMAEKMYTKAVGQY